MKTWLTREQSEHLILLGVPEENASRWPQHREEVNGKIIVDEQYPIFTLADLLELLPPEIEEKGSRVIKYNHIWKQELAYYDRANMVPCKNEEMVVCLYELLCWVIENEYLKFN